MISRMPEGQLPELARSLRALGTQRDVAADAAHGAIFTPLLEARARAGTGSVDRALAALKGASLSSRIETLVIAAAVEGVVDPARVRALTAQAIELLDSLKKAFVDLDERAEAARTDSTGWDAWVDALRHVYAESDGACSALVALIASRDATRRSGSWFSRGSA